MEEPANCNFIVRPHILPQNRPSATPHPPVLPFHQSHARPPRLKSTNMSFPDSVLWVSEKCAPHQPVLSSGTRGCFHSCRSVASLRPTPPETWLTGQKENSRRMILILCQTVSAGGHYPSIQLFSHPSGAVHVFVNCPPPPPHTVNSAGICFWHWADNRISGGKCVWSVRNVCFFF